KLLCKRVGSKPLAATSTVFAARSSVGDARSGRSPSEMQKPSASSSSWPGVRIVTATGLPSMRISSGSSAATRSRSRAPSGRRTTSTSTAEYGGASTRGMLRRAVERRDDVLVDGPVAVDRRADVPRRQPLGPTLERLGDLVRGVVLGDDLGVLDLRLAQHPADELIELGQRLVRALGELLLERTHLRFPLLPVEPGLHACVLRCTAAVQTPDRIAR